MNVDRWSVAHRYNNLVKAGLAKPLTSDTGEVYILRANKDYEPAYWLPSNDSWMEPGLGFWFDLRDTIDRVDIDSLGTQVLQ